MLERIARDPDPAGPDGERSPRWNRDTVWFSAAEVREALPEDAAPGASIDLGTLAPRLARFALVDNVRGQSLP